MATLEKLRRVVGGKIGMDYTNAGTERDLIDEWCSQGVREVLLRSHCYVATSTIDTTADEWQYDLSYAVMAIVQIWRDGETYPMVRVTPEEIIDLRRSSSATSDATVLRWALQGTNMVLLWPTPTAAYSINLLYVPRPTELSFDTHDPSTATYGGVPVEYHKAIEMYALAEAADWDDDTSSQSGIAYRARFEDELAKVKSGTAWKGGRMPRARVGRRQVRYNSDVYPA